MDDCYFIDPGCSLELAERTGTQVTRRANRKKRLTVLYIVEHPNQEGDTCIDWTSQYCWTNGWNCLWRGHSVYRNRPLIPLALGPVLRALAGHFGAPSSSGHMKCPPPPLLDHRVLMEVWCGRECEGDTDVSPVPWKAGAPTAKVMPNWGGQNVGHADTLVCAPPQALLPETVRQRARPYSTAQSEHTALRSCRPQSRTTVRRAISCPALLCGVGA